MYARVCDLSVLVVWYDWVGWVFGSDGCLSVVDCFLCGCVMVWFDIGWSPERIPRS